MPGSSSYARSFRVGSAEVGAWLLSPDVLLPTLSDTLGVEGQCNGGMASTYSILRPC
jgi:hypothetical protein